jgi:putative FmdB family regulatory protein
LKKSVICYLKSAIKERKMPIYEYRCRKCGEVFEKIQKINEGGEHLTCPSCGGKKPEKVLSCFSSSKGTDSSPSCGPSGGSSRFS